MANLYNVNSVNSVNSENSVIILGQSNIIQLCNICERFFLEKYNINVTQDTLTKTIPILLKKIIAFYGKNPPLPNIQEINKIAMQRMKDFILSRMQQDQTGNNDMQPKQPQQPQILTPLPPPISTQNIDINANANTNAHAHAINDTNLQTTELKYDPYDLHNIANVTNPTTNANNATNATNINTDQNIDHNEIPIDKVTEDQFFIRLKNLESTRNNTSSIKTPINETFLTQTIQPSLQQPFQQPVVIQQLLATNKNEITKSIIINAVNRDWIYFNERNAFIWSGPLIPIETSSFKLANTLLPKRVSKYTPIVILEITGASNKVIDFVIILENIGVTWDSWKCVNNGIIQNISSPWTLKLLDENRIPINMGKDGSLIKTVARLYNNNSQITIEPFMNCITVGTRLKCITQKQDKNDIFNVLNINGNNIELEGNAEIYLDGIICNLSYQPYIIIDYTLTN